MKERPILFSGPMIRAILDGRKTQTRRIVKQQPPRDLYHLEQMPGGEWRDEEISLGKCPYGEIGDRIWASRIKLEITDVRVERLQDITEKDATNEGISDGGCLNCGNSSYPDPCGCNAPSPSLIDAFVNLWESINGFLSWQENPWVWVIDFQRITP